MKYLIFLFAAVLGQNLVAAPINVNQKEVVKRVSEKNYKVLENALKVYQAKTSIEKARADLLPKLNIWSIAKIIIDPTSIIDQIPDMAPFLVPANWFRLEEVKLLYLAEREGYRALWGNEVHIAKTMYSHLLFDQQLLKHIEISTLDLQKVHRIVKTREAFGGVKPGTAREIEIRILGLQEDQENLKVLLAQEQDELSYVLGYPSDDELILQPIEMPVFESLKPIPAKDYEFRVLSMSPERRQFDHFLSALSQVRKEILYSFLGGSNMSRGVAGGIFDNLPTGNGIGFGNGAALKIVDAQKEVMKTQKLGVEETLKRQLRAVTTQFNSDVANYANFKRRVELSRESKEGLLRRINLGENVDVLELSEASRNQIQAETSLFAVEFRTVISQDRFYRLIFENDYSMSPPLIDSLKGNKP